MEKDVSNLFAFKLLNDYRQKTDCDSRPIDGFSAKRWLSFENTGMEHQLRWSDGLTFIRAFCSRSLVATLLARVRRPCPSPIGPGDGTGSRGSSVCLLRRLFSPLRQCISTHEYLALSLRMITDCLIPGSGPFFKLLSAFYYIQALLPTRLCSKPHLRLKRHKFLNRCLSDLTFCTLVTMQPFWTLPLSWQRTGIPIRNSP